MSKKTWDSPDFLSSKSAYTDLLAITQGIQKCQYVLYSEKINLVEDKLLLNAFTIT